MNELERMPEKEKKKLVDLQKDYNMSSKAFVHIISANITLCVCLLLPLLLICFIWTDIGAPVFDVKLVSDAIVTVALFVIGQTMMMQVGSSGGKLDQEYLTARKDFDTLVGRVNDAGTMFMSVFCEWQIDVEMEQAVATRLRHLRFTQNDLDRVKDKSYRELVKKYGRKKAHGIMALTRLEPIELNEAILLFDNTDALARGGVPISGEEYIHKKSHSIQMILSAIFAGLVTVSVAITLTQDASFSRVVYTAFKLVLLLYRMAEGYNVGAKAYNSVEVKQLKTKNTYLRQYLRFVEDKTYLKFGDKYGDIKCFIEAEEPTQETTNQ